ncbi:hypothetical protein ALC56_03914 [Trachymyrmex septentrionalis]|uniref:DNA-directed DNA polymerase n=1 Tax=Trachymyrmex septentrionalis TaxID=34720 RepID=A0A151JYX0_9HYME|nr:hypothetical protein ALC56_03914 [Trachymyrmex septentrionalis]
MVNVDYIEQRRFLQDAREIVLEKLLTKWDGRYGAEAMIAKPNFHSRNVFAENLIAVELRKLEVKFDKPIYVGICILDISKVCLYEFHHEYMLPLFRDKCKIMYTDTDSLIYRVECEDIYETIKRNIARFDTSDYPTDNSVKLHRFVTTRSQSEPRSRPSDQTIILSSNKCDSTRVSTSPNRPSLLESLDRQGNRAVESSSHLQNTTSRRFSAAGYRFFRELLYRALQDNWRLPCDFVKFASAHRTIEEEKRRPGLRIQEEQLRTDWPGRPASYHPGSRRLAKRLRGPQPRMATLHPSIGKSPMTELRRPLRSRKRRHQRPAWRCESPAK